MPRLAIEDVPQSDSVEAGWYQLEVVALEEAISSTGKLMYNGQFAIAEGPAGIGQIIFQTYVIGTPDDLIPEDDIPLEYVHEGNAKIPAGTVVKNFGARALSRLFRYGLNLPPDDSLDVLCEEALKGNKRFDARITVQTQEEGEYAGREQNRITEYAPEGSKDLGFIQKKKSSLVKGRSQPSKESSARQGFQGQGQGRTRRQPTEES